MAYFDVADGLSHCVADKDQLGIIEDLECCIKKGAKKRIVLVVEFECNKKMISMTHSRGLVGFFLVLLCEIL